VTVELGGDCTQRRRWRSSHGGAQQRVQHRRPLTGAQLRPARAVVRAGGGEVDVCEGGGWQPTAQHEEHSHKGPISYSALNHVTVVVDNLEVREPPLSAATEAEVEAEQAQTQACGLLAGGDDFLHAGDGLPPSVRLQPRAQRRRGQGGRCGGGRGIAGAARAGNWPVH
jgi:hypothetical protein